MLSITVKINLKRNFERGGQNRVSLVENLEAIGDVCFSSSFSSIGDDDKSIISSDVVGIGSDVDVVGKDTCSDDASSLFAADAGLETSTGFGNSGSGGWIGSDVAIGGSGFGSVFLFSLKSRREQLRS